MILQLLCIFSIFSFFQRKPLSRVPSGPLIHTQHRCVHPTPATFGSSLCGCDALAPFSWCYDPSYVTKAKPIWTSSKLRRSSSAAGGQRILMRCGLRIYWKNQLWRIFTCGTSFFYSFFFIYKYIYIFHVRLHIWRWICSSWAWMMTSLWRDSLPFFTCDSFQLLFAFFLFSFSIFPLQMLKRVSCLIPVRGLSVYSVMVFITFVFSKSTCVSLVCRWILLLPGFCRLSLCGLVQDTSNIQPAECYLALTNLSWFLLNKRFSANVHQACFHVPGQS